MASGGCRARARRHPRTAARSPGPAARRHGQAGPDQRATDQRAAGADRDAGTGRPQRNPTRWRVTWQRGTGRGSRSGAGSGKSGAARGTARGARRPGGPGRAADGPEVVAGRNAVLESLRAAVPANALYVAHRMESDDRVNEAIRLAGDAGVAVLEAGRAELDRLTDGASAPGRRAAGAAYEYAHPGDLTGARGRHRGARTDRGARRRDRPA